MSKQLKKKMLCEFRSFRLQSTMFQPIFVPVGLAHKSLSNARNSASPRPTLNSFKSDFPFFSDRISFFGAQNEREQCYILLCVKRKKIDIKVFKATQ